MLYSSFYIIYICILHIRSSVFVFFFSLSPCLYLLFSVFLSFSSFTRATQQDGSPS